MRYLYLLLLLAAFVAAAVAQPGLPGHWEGTVELPAGSTGPNILALDLARDSQGAWTASLGVPQQNVSGLTVADLHIEGSKLKFNAPDVPGKASFDLNFADGKLAGTVSTQGLAMRIEMKRSGEAKVEVTPASLAVSKEFEGDWEAAFTLSDGRLRPIQVHFRNQPDHTVAATLDSPTQGFHGSLDRVVQSGNTVKFHVHLYGGAYEGTLNAAGTEIAGTWIQGGANPPTALTLKKK